MSVTDVPGCFADGFVFETDEKVTTVGLRVEGHFDTIYHFCCCLEGSSYHSCALCLIFSDAEEFVFVSLPWTAHPPRFRVPNKVHFTSCSSISVP